MKLTIGFLLACLGMVSAQTPMKALNRRVEKIVAEVSAERVGAVMKKLEGFGTRDLFSSLDNPKRGIGAASRRWTGKG